MKKNLLALFVLLMGCCPLFSQDTTRILFIGNSFTYFNNMPWMVKAMADSADIPAYVAMHAPGGISVGDIAQGNMAHMNNPTVYNLIRSKKWDFVVIQDNQGRFVRDSAQFPSTAASLVVQGHFKLMDSIKANNSCAKVILFGGWAWKYGMPPYGNTGIETIRRILCNYRVLNDSMQEVVAPIGEAWIKSSSYMPAVNLWDPDDAHPSYSGSYLTASVIFSTIFNMAAKPINYNGTLAPATAYNLRAYGDTAVFNPLFHTKYNLGGVKDLSIQETAGQLLVPGTYVSYEWYKNGLLIGNAPIQPATTPGNYQVIVTEPDGCIIKSCKFAYAGPSTGISALETEAGLAVYPNPVSGGLLQVETGLALQKAEFVDMSGTVHPAAIESNGKGFGVKTGGLKAGCYLLVVSNKDQVLRKKVMVCD